MSSLAEFKPSAGRIFVNPRRPQISGLAEFKPKLLLSRPEIYSKPAWGSRCIKYLTKALQMLYVNERYILGLSAVQHIWWVERCMEVDDRARIDNYL